jgi:predicted Ser/Thr protein kinase
MHNVAFMHFRYGIYDSIRPATFVRKPLIVKSSQRSSTSSRASSSKFPDRSVDIIIHTELEPGSTGVVHIGTMEVDSWRDRVEIAVKIAFTHHDKSTLLHEHSIYNHLHSRNVRRVPQPIGIFVDEELLDGGEGPHALITTFAGTALSSASNDIPYDTKSVHSDPLPRTNVDCHHRKLLLATLERIHRAGVIHGDISMANLCIRDDQEAFIIDFTHARFDDNPKVQAAEMATLRRLLEIDTSRRGRSTRDKPVEIMKDAFAVQRVRPESLRHSTGCVGTEQVDQVTEFHGIETSKRPAKRMKVEVDLSALPRNMRPQEENASPKHKLFGIPILRRRRFERV